MNSSALRSSSAKTVAVAAATASLLLGFLFFAPKTDAHTDPVTCNSTGVSLSFTVYREDGVTAVGGGAVITGETIKYQATLNHAGGNNCNYGGGNLDIITPDGVIHDVDGGTVALVSAGSPFLSSVVTYVATGADVGGDSDLDASAVYSGGASHLGETNVVPVGATTPAATPYIAPLVVNKTAVTSFDRKWNWTIDKTVNDNSLLLQEGESYTANYVVTVGATSETINENVSGTITITNPAGNPTATVATVTDDLSIEAGTVAVVCPQTLPYALAAGASLVCTYSQAMTTPTNQTNSATVTTTGSVPGGSDTEAVTFGSTAANVIDECIVVDDTNPKGPQDVVVCENTADKTLEYSVTFGPAGVGTDVAVTCGEIVHPNTASFLTQDDANDTDAIGSDSQSVTVNVNCAQGCTLTQGYWKTHNASFKGGAPVDAGWMLIGGSKEFTSFYSSGTTWFGVFWTAPKGNVYYNLAHQYMAAKLNILNGATAPANVATAITSAEALLSANTPAQAALLKGGAKQSWTTLAGTLGSFNEGLIGPGHCDEQNPI